MLFLKLLESFAFLPPGAGKNWRKSMKLKKGNGLLSILAVLMLFVSISAGAASAAQINSDTPLIGETPVEDDMGDFGILSTLHMGSLSTDGDGDTANAVCVGSVTAPAGQNTFLAAYSNVNDRDNDGQGAIYRLTVWDALGVGHTAEKRVDWVTSGTISVSFNSQGSGDAHYELWCETHDWFDTTKATDTDFGDLDYV